MLSLIYGILMFILLIVLLIHSIRHRREIRSYIKYGIVLGVILIVLDGAVVLCVPNFFEAIPIFQFVILDVIAFVKIVVFTCMGIYCCSILGIVDIPLMKRLAGRNQQFWRIHQTEQCPRRNRSDRWGNCVFLDSFQSDISAAIGVNKGNVQTSRRQTRNKRRAFVSAGACCYNICVW